MIEPGASCSVLPWELLVRQLGRLLQLYIGEGVGLVEEKQDGHLCGGHVDNVGLASVAELHISIAGMVVQE